MAVIAILFCFFAERRPCIFRPSRLPQGFHPWFQSVCNGQKPYFFVLAGIFLNSPIELTPFGACKDQRLQFAAGQAELQRPIVM